MPGTDPPDAAPRSKRDLVSEVLDYYNAQLSALRESTGMRKTEGLSMTDERKREIAARLREVEGTDADKVGAAIRVIDVQVYQVQTHGQSTSTEAARRDWKMLRTSTLFAAKNFTRWLDRWSEDGDHELWFQPRRSALPPGSFDGMGSGIGSAARWDERRAAARASGQDCSPVTWDEIPDDGMTF
jgi:hypothetical protein